MGKEDLQFIAVKSDFEAYTFKELNLAKLNSRHFPMLDDLWSFDLVVIPNDNPFFTRSMVTQIRAAKHPKFYLVPIVLIGHRDEIEKDILYLVDDVIIEFKELEQSYEKVLNIRERINALIQD